MGLAWSSFFLRLGILNGRWLATLTVLRCSGAKVRDRAALG